MSTPLPDTDTRPWYRQFWPWFLITIPLASVIGSVFMIGLAIQTHDGRVRDYYRSDGRSVRQDLARDQVALERGLRARLEVDAETGGVRVDLGGSLLDYPPHLQLLVIHPTRANRDLDLVLRHLRGGRYVGALESAALGRRSLQLTDPAEEWRLVLDPVLFPLRDAAVLESRLAP